ncbi:plasmid stabilization protein StbA [Photorhabdus luminescens]|uniref:plasmid stabilization protein StbA n=1 Tax=Photorhabdus luminescens TaxID=29488 RepID=UPI00223F8384|nr:plasmid stabilization protein StbA [Photorhabdus luminescens]MCW7764561.1 StbA [Photorhabdus luminescens subsp. venezuelensis]
MKPKSIRAAIQMMLPEVEEMLSLGVSREDVFKAVSDRFGLENVNVRSFDTALYRARQNRLKLGNASSRLHNTDEVITSPRNRVLYKAQEDVQKEEENASSSPGIIRKEFFDKINDSFDPKIYVDKY